MAQCDMKWPHTMVDLETGGLSPDKAPIIQIAAVRFNLYDLTIDTDDFFEVCLEVPETREWDAGTAHWWAQQKAGILASIQARAISPAEAMQQFFDWACQEPGSAFVAKPSHFDFAFVESYWREFGYISPFHFRACIDLNSFLRGRYFPNPVPNVEIPDFGDAHQALTDCLMQIATLFMHCEEKK